MNKSTAWRAFAVTALLASAVVRPTNSQTLLDRSQLPLYNQSSNGAVNRSIVGKLQETISVLDFGADPTGSRDSSSAVQSAVTAAHAVANACVVFPTGSYKLSTPVTLAGVECLRGENGAMFTGATTLLPTTAAFVTSGPLTDHTDLNIHDFYIFGGTNDIDLGLFHNVHISDITCNSYSGWCISHVRGERHEIRDINCWHQTASAQGCISVASAANSIFASTYAAVNWSGNDQWFDRATIEHVIDLWNSTPSLSDQYLLYSGGGSGGSSDSGAFSDTIVRNILCHGSGSTSCMKFYKVQLSTFQNIVTDNIGTSSNPVPIVFDVEGAWQFSTLDGFYPAFSGNAYYTVGAYFGADWVGGVIKNCNMGGNNSTQFGLKFSANQNRYGQITSCAGAYYNASTNPLWRDQITMTGSAMSPINSSAVVNMYDNTNSGMNVTLMADNNGAAAATSAFQIKRATGGGNNALDFSINSNNATIRLPLIPQGGIKSGNSENSDLSGELNFSSSRTATYSFSSNYSSHPECWIVPQFSIAGNTPWVTYTGATSFTINFSTAVTGSVSFGCLGRS